MIKIVIPGRPVPCVRMTHKSKWTNPQAQRYLLYKQNVGWTAAAELNGTPIITRKVEINIRFYFKNNKLPDLDNLIKAILDGLNKIAWEDDKQVVKITAERLKDTNERAEVEISEVA